VLSNYSIRSFAETKKIKKKTMKILFVTQGYFPAIGGTEILIQRVAEELVTQYEDDVTIFTTNCYSGEAFFTPSMPRMTIGFEKINGVQVRRFSVNSRVSKIFRKLQGVPYHLKLPGNQYLRLWAGGPIIPDLQRAIEQAEYDIVVSSSFPLMHMFTTLKAAKNTKRPCVFNGGLHPEDLWGFDRPMIYNAIQQTDAYIANTHYEKNYLIERGISPLKITVVGAGVDPGPFAALDQKQVRIQLNIDLDIPLIGFIGQIGGHKGVDTLLKSMPFIWDEFPDAQLLIAGARTLFCSELERIMNVWTEEQRSKIVFYYDFPNEIKPALFSAVDIFAYPSGYESFGIAFLEAWAAKKPVIGTWKGAIPWVVNAGRDGLLVRYQNPENLAGAISILLQNSELCKQYGETGYIKAVSRYSWSEIARRFRSVFESVFNKISN
jgi:glycosyltransferase involved in cell wall biosynthesis